MSIDQCDSSRLKSIFLKFFPDDMEDDSVLSGGKVRWLVTLTIFPVCRPGEHILMLKDLKGLYWFLLVLTPNTEPVFIPPTCLSVSFCRMTRNRAKLKSIGWWTPARTMWRNRLTTSSSPATALGLTTTGKSLRINTLLLHKFFPFCFKLVFCISFYLKHLP